MPYSYWWLGVTAYFSRKLLGESRCALNKIHATAVSYGFRSVLTKWWRASLLRQKVSWPSSATPLKAIPSSKFAIGGMRFSLSSVGPQTRASAASRIRGTSSMSFGHTARHSAVSAPVTL